MKKILSFFLVLLMCFLFISPGVTYAATVKLNKTKITLDEGKTYSLKVTGTTKAVKWATTNKKVATVSSKGIVTGVSKGTANITATVSSKKYTCKVTVKEAFNAKKAISKLKVEEEDLGNELVVILKNGYSFSYSLTATAVFYDEKGKMLGKSTNDNYYFEPGKECALNFRGPYDADYRNVPYASYKLTYQATPISSSIKSTLSDISITSNIGADNVMVEVTNNGEVDAKYTVISVIFYQGGVPVGYNYRYSDAEAPGSVDYLEFSFPYDSEYNTIPIDDFKVFVNYSYYYARN